MRRRCGVQLCGGWGKLVRISAFTWGKLVRNSPSQVGHAGENAWGMHVGNDTAQGGVLYQDSGVSEEARQVERRTAEAVERIRSQGHWVARSELIGLLEACGRAGWDGDQGRAVSASTYANARDFLSALPAAFPSPEVSVTEDGAISFDWFPGPDSLFSVSVTEEGKLFFAAVTPTGRSSGIERFEGRLPEVISQTSPPLPNDAWTSRVTCSSPGITRPGTPE